MTQKDKMLRLVLSDEKLQETYGFDAADYEDVYEAKDSDNPVVSAVAQIILELNGSEDETDQKRVYKSIFAYFNNYLLS